MNPHINLAPPAGLSPLEQLIVAAALSLARRRVRITPEAIAEEVGLPTEILGMMWRAKSLEDAG